MSGRFQQYAPMTIMRPLKWYVSKEKSDEIRYTCFNSDIFDAGSGVTKYVSVSRSSHNVRSFVTIPSSSQPVLYPYWSSVFHWFEGRISRRMEQT
jgi:hypothetical protein